MAVEAVINGDLYVGCQDNANTSGALNVASSKGLNADYMEVNFGGPAAVGTTTVSQGITTFQVQNSSGALWVASQNSGSGSLTISTLTATGATGTFFFTAPATGGGATGNMVATGGTFNVTF